MFIIKFKYINTLKNNVRTFSLSNHICLRRMRIINFSQKIRHENQYEYVKNLNSKERRNLENTLMKFNKHRIVHKNEATKIIEINKQELYQGIFYIFI